MCGITGYINTDSRCIPNTAVIREMLGAQKHRGPDDSGIMAFSLKNQKAQEYIHQQTQEINDPFEGILGFNRLSILDLSANGHQPMSSPDGNVLLMLNGEIYNAFDLKPALIADGCKFKSTTDTEVVLYLYLKYGFRGMVERLNGMFAIVVADLREGKLYITRDRFGIKPMYFYNKNGVLAFSSELKSFYALDQFNATVNTGLLDEYLIFKNNLNKTLINDVQRIAPGHYLTYSSGQGISFTQYFDVNHYERQSAKGADFEEALNKLHDVLEKSVQSQLMSDVKLGCQLSGGVDSSLVTWLAKDIKQDNLLESVSIVFDDKRFNEKPFIDKVANQLGIISHQFPLQSEFYQDSIRQATWHLEEPINHPNTIGIYLLAQKAKEYVTVLLSGEGADEVFGGYARFYAVMYPYANKKFFSGLKQSVNNPFKFLRQYTDPFTRANLGVATMTEQMALSLKPDFRYANATCQRKAVFDELTGSVFDKQVKYDMATYLPDLLTRQDKMSMAHSIENRVPFLDNRVVDHSFTIPTNYLIKRKAAESNNTEKYILKKMCGNVFGDEFAFRNKMGFGIPLREFLAKPAFNSYLREEILPGIEKRNLLNSNKIAAWINNLEQISVAELDALWVVTGLEIWMKQFIDR
ncbi:asparagine synthase (glutamine-hydrolyzing) [Ferruginibacter paludis]|uniref:asparagine synthase (glutamine-hydrolyzing) n=1 Tax=Ferruginibacter paludis TaxID=1310417 RepID=UPI0025B2B432|nr:asparagine synthase (glutamine-hydrolyzing) [Ferruginibacter paludis]MDN3658892.1 asparagine synthase (glutamine-hydrolyzing) [Ferruginibacter paludis]